MVKSGTVPVLLKLCRCRHTEVVHQAVRALAQLCNTLVRGFSVADLLTVNTRHGTVEKMRPIKSVEETQDEQLRLFQANEALRVLLGLLTSNNPFVQVRAQLASSREERCPTFLAASGVTP